MSIVQRLLAAFRILTGRNLSSVTVVNDHVFTQYLAAGHYPVFNVGKKDARDRLIMPTEESGSHHPSTHFSMAMKPGWTIDVTFSRSTGDANE